MRAFGEKERRVHRNRAHAWYGATRMGIGMGFGFGFGLGMEMGMRKKVGEREREEICDEFFKYNNKKQKEGRERCGAQLKAVLACMYKINGYLWM